MDKPEISNVKVSFIQEGNTLGTTEAYEYIEICLEFPSSESDGPFIVFKTNGWSINDSTEIYDLIDRTKSILQKK